MWFDRDSAQFILGTAVLHCSNTVNNCSTSITNQPTNQLLSILSFQFVRMLWGMGVCHALADVCLQPDGPSCHRGCDDTHGPSGRLRRYQLCRGVQQGPPVCPVLLKGYQQCHVGFSSTWVHFYDFFIIASWHRNTLRITVPLGGKYTGHRRTPPPGPHLQMASGGDPGNFVTLLFEEP